MPALVTPVSHPDSTDAPLGAAAPSNAALMRRLVVLGWRYRWVCLRLLLLQGLLLGSALVGLRLTGVGIDVVLYRAGAISRPLAWPLGLAPPVDWSGPQEVALISAAILVLSLVRGWLNYVYAVAAGVLVHEQIVVDLR